MLLIQQLGKPVVAALNGLALGGGSELALACTARIARKGLKVCFGQPEVNLGIIPGAGATQRLPRVVGMALAWELLRTGRTVPGDEAEEIGYLREQVEGDLLARAIELARELPMETIHENSFAPIEFETTLRDIDIQHRSRKVDEILRKAILEGCAKPIEEGVRFESDCFGEVCGTKDKRIGIENFRKTQLREPAPFVHA
jgi:enoyl-CoA hydratase/carnithine racemase